MAHGTESVLRTVHLAELKALGDSASVTAYIKKWNKTCPKGEELSDGQRRTLQRWLNGGLGANYKRSQTGVAKRVRRCRNRKEEGKKVVETTDTFVFE